MNNDIKKMVEQKKGYVFRELLEATKNKRIKWKEAHDSEILGYRADVGELVLMLEHVDTKGTLFLELRDSNKFRLSFATSNNQESSELCKLIDSILQVERLEKESRVLDRFSEELLTALVEERPSKD